MKESVIFVGQSEASAEAFRITSYDRLACRQRAEYDRILLLLLIIPLRNCFLEHLNLFPLLIFYTDVGKFKTRRFHFYLLKSASFVIPFLFLTVLF